LWLLNFFTLLTDIITVVRNKIMDIENDFMI